MVFVLNHRRYPNLSVSMLSWTIGMHTNRGAVSFTFQRPTYILSVFRICSAIAKMAIIDICSDNSNTRYSPHRNSQLKLGGGGPRKRLDKKNESVYKLERDMLYGMLGKQVSVERWINSVGVMLELQNSLNGERGPSRSRRVFHEFNKFRRIWRKQYPPCRSNCCEFWIASGVN